MTDYAEIHAVQGMPPNCLNRGLDGSPKTAIFGGLQRARVSSQSWKRAMRTYISPASIRTRRADEWVVNFLGKMEWADEKQREAAEKLAKDLFRKATGADDASPAEDDAAKENAPVEEDPSAAEVADQERETDRSVMALFSVSQLEAFANFVAKTVKAEGRRPTAKILKEGAVEALKAGSSEDVLLWGRMFAKERSLNVDACFQVAHAIGVSARSPEFDDLTAFDEFDNQAGHLTSSEFISDPLYRYGSINFDKLVQGCDGDTQRARLIVKHAVEAFLMSMPTGKTNSFASITLPEYVQVVISKRPLNLSGAFEAPVEPRTGMSLIDVSAKKLEDYQEKLQGIYGDRLAPSHTFILGGTKTPNIDALLDAICEALG